MDSGPVRGQLRLTLVCTCLFRCAHSLFSRDGFSISLILLEAICSAPVSRQVRFPASYRKRLIGEQEMALPSPLPCISAAWHSIRSLVQHNHSHQSGWRLEVMDKHRCSLTAEHLGNERGMSGTRWEYPTCAMLFDRCCAIQLGPTWNPKDKWKVYVQ